MKKISRRSFLAAAGVSAAALALTACGGSSKSTAASSAPAASTAASAAAGDAAAAANDPKVTLVYAEVNPLDTIVGQTATHFKEKVEELTGGSVVIDVQASGVLGSENDVLDAILGGSKLKDAFHARYGCTITQYIQGQRMERAEQLLANTDLPVGQIAQIVGYQNPSRFAQLFRRSTGQSPAAFRAFSHPREAE